MARDANESIGEGGRGSNGGDARTKATLSLPRIEQGVAMLPITVLDRRFHDVRRLPHPAHLPPKPRRIGGIWGKRTRRPPAQILGRNGRGASHGRGEESRLGPSQRTGSQRRRDSSTTPRWLKSRYPQPRLASTTIASDQATSLWSAVPRRTCSDDPRRHHRRSLRGESRNAVGDLSPVTLNLINPHVGDARLPESKRYAGLRRNVDHSATDERSPANDRDHHVMAIIEVDDADLRPHRQAAMRRNQSSETRILKL